MRLTLLLLMIIMCAPALAAPPVFYVSPSGNDAWSGTLADANGIKTDGPFATLLHARDALRATGTADGLPEGGTVYVRGGTYFLRDGLTLEAQDSAAPGHTVLWSAYKDEKVDLIGGLAVAGFEKYKDEILQRDCADLALPAPLQQLFMDGARQTLARWPDKGSGELPGGGWAFVAASIAADSKKAFTYSGEEISALANVPGMEISIWPNYNWWQTIAPVAAIDAATKTLRLPADISYTIEPGRRFFLQNALQLLDAPGEWFYDAAQKRLYFWPPAPITLQSQVIAPTGNTVLQATGLQRAAVIGLSIKAAYGDGVLLKDCEDVLYAKATVCNTYGFGVVVQGGHSVRIHGNDIFATGKGGITLSGGDRKTLTPGNHEAMNNHIHDYAQIFQTYNCGVNINGVGNRIRHNLIHDAPHIGILLTGNDHLIEYNDIHHVCLEGADNGAFYMGRDWTQRGNVLRFNKIHDVYGFGLANEQAKDGSYRYESPHQAWGVYLDDCSSGTTITHNLFYRVPLCGVMVGGGRDNAILNNIFVDCTPAFHIDDRWDTYPWDLMQERLKAMNYAEPPYSGRYPDLLKMGDDPRTPANNRFERNLVAYSKDEFRGLSTTAPSSGKGIIYDLSGYDAATSVFKDNVIQLGGLPVRVFSRPYKHPEEAADLTWEQWQAKGFDVESLIGGVEFVDHAKDDYRIVNPNKAIKRLKFNAIPFENMGLIKDELRATWPVEQAPPKDDSQHKEWTITVTP